jgi:transcriptional regulator with XRE-family HTH domain
MAHILLKHIAEEAGVSVTTVSFVLNGKAKEKRISDAIIEKVEKIIEAKNFKPNALNRKNGYHCFNCRRYWQCFFCEYRQKSRIDCISKRV